MGLSSSGAAFRGVILAITLAFAAFIPRKATSAGLTLDPSSFANPSSLISTDLANSAARAVGLLADHRAYEPATTLPPPVGIDISIEATLVKIPKDFVDKLVELGMLSSSIETAIPVPKINIHKRLGNRAEVGISGIVFRGYRVMGGDFKLNIYKPTEGLAWALRLNYNTATIGFVKTKSYTPELLCSVPLDFAEPYAGIGYQYALGEVSVVIDPSLPPPYNEPQTASGRGGGFLAFAGVGFKIPMLGVKLTLEGGYSPVGAHSLGTKFGLNF